MSCHNQPCSFEQYHALKKTLIKKLFPINNLQFHGQNTPTTFKTENIDNFDTVEINHNASTRTTRNIFHFIRL